MTFTRLLRLATHVRMCCVCKLDIWTR